MLTTCMTFNMVDKMYFYKPWNEATKLINTLMSYGTFLLFALHS